MNTLRILLDVSLLQAKPQDVPFSFQLLAVSTVASVVSYVLALDPVGAEVARVLGREISIVPLAMAEHLFFAATLWAILRIRRRTERFVQTTTAMFGVSAIMQLVMWPITGWLLRHQGTPDANLPAFLIFGLRIWILIVYANIFKETLDTGIRAGLLYTVACWMITSVLLLLVIDLIS